MAPEEVAWLAGILEGEGSFLSGASIGITVAMTDQDVIQRLQSLTGVGRIHKVGRQKAHHKDAWVWAVRRRTHIRLLIDAVLPWLGQRRSVAALKVLDRIAALPRFTTVAGVGVEPT
jgi:hypothetical protein